MLTILADSIMTSLRKKRWDAPEHFKHQRGPRSSIDLEREAAEQRYRAMRNVGMW